MGFLTGIGAVILVDVATQDREAPPDTRDIYLVHAMFRRKFAALPTIVRGVAAADAERADLIAEHMGLLEAHHRADDTHLWPKLLDRGGEDLGPIVHVMEEQHKRIEQLTAKAVVALVSGARIRPRSEGPAWTRAAVSRSGVPRDDHSSHLKFRSIRRRNSNDS